MTVCVAARSYNSVFFASDRMITAGDVQFEPAVPKVVFLTPAIAIMAAGDSSFHAEVVQQVIRDIHIRIEAEPENWWLVKDVVELYVHHRNQEKLKRAESSVLAPLGLDRNSFLNQQHIMDSNLVDKIARDLINFDVPDVSVIILGLDRSGGLGTSINTHIYTIHSGEVRCDDAISFSAIGSGGRHAESHIMMAGHVWNNDTSKTLLLTYSAKKNAEIAPGVGIDTDMFMIGPDLGKNTVFGSEILRVLEEQYQLIKQRHAEIQGEANTAIEKYVRDLGTEAASAQADNPATAESEAPGSGEGRTGKPH